MPNSSYTILINKDSGYVIRCGQKEVENKIMASNINVESVYFLSPKDISEKLTNDKGRKKNYLIGGGDGTIKMCAELALNHGFEFGIIPMGTMNLMARNLEIPDGIEDALNHYAKGTIVTYVDVGMINNEPFLCCAGIGGMTEASEIREKERKDNSISTPFSILNIVLKQMDRLRHRKLYITIDGKMRKLETAVLIISNNQYGEQGKLGAENFKRKSLQDGELGIYSVSPENLWDKLRLILRLVGGKWTKDPVVRQWKGETVSVDTGNYIQKLSLDGENSTAIAPLNFWVRPLALALVVPKYREA